MAEIKPWCWQAAQDAKGPDWLLLAHVTAGSIPALVEASANLQLDGYTGLIEPHDHGCAAYTLIDNSNAAVYQNNLRGSEQHNIWIYNLIQVYHDTVMVEAGYGGRGDAYARLETGLLVHLFVNPGITLQRWQVLAGGNGYDYSLLQGGTDAGSFLAYLHD